MTDARLVYVTAKDREEALALGRELVGRRLVACVNVFAGMTSVYRWENKIEQADEVVLILKTTAANAEATVAAVRELHSYSVPCVLVVPILAGNPGYLDWLAASVKEP